MADVGDPRDLRVVVGVDEVDVVGGPAHHEDPDHHREHLHKLPHTLYKVMETKHSHSHPLLVLPALDECRVGGHAGDGGGGVAVPQVESHLEVAEHHAHHGEEVGHQEQDDVVPAFQLLYG